MLPREFLVLVNLLDQMENANEATIIATKEILVIISATTKATKWNLGLWIYNGD